MKRFLCLCLTLLVFCSGCQQAAQENISIDVYTVDAEGEYITRTSKEVTPQSDMPLLYVTSMVQANQTLFPEGISVLSVSLEGNTATVDFSQELRTVSEQDFLYINELCALAVSQGERQQGDKIAKVNLLCEGEQLPGYFQYPYSTRLVDQASQANFPIWMLRLYFPNRENTCLIREYRLVPEGKNAQTLVLEELRQGTEDPDNKKNILPYNAKILQMRPEEDTLYLNFSSEFVDDCTPGQEALLLQAVTACYSEFIAVNQVQFAIEGDSQREFGGVSLTQPMTVDPAYFADPQAYFSEE